MFLASGCSKSTFFVVMTLAVLVPQEGVTQDIPEPQSLGRMTPVEAESDKKSDKLPEDFSNEALDAVSYTHLRAHENSDRLKSTAVSMSQIGRWRKSSPDSQQRNR